MGNKAVQAVIEYLEGVNREIKRLEAEGEEIIGDEGQAAFQAKLEEKAELLAGLSGKAADVTAAVDGDLGESIHQRLSQFSTSASTALRIGSVFFMTALLYPEDHQPGDPNDLEVFIETLRNESQGRE